MNVNDYQKQAEVTENKDFVAIAERFTNVDTMRLIHATFGLISELGEFAGQLKKHLFYGTPLDKVNLSEESGDLLWYLALAANVPGMKSLDEDMQLNIAKLRKRFGGKFSEFDAVNRDTAAERVVLEGLGDTGAPENKATTQRIEREKSDHCFGIHFSTSGVEWDRLLAIRGKSWVEVAITDEGVYDVRQYYRATPLLDGGLAVNSVSRFFKGELGLLSNQGWDIYFHLSNGKVVTCLCSVTVVNGGPPWTDASKCPIHKEQAESANRRY